MKSKCDVRGLDFSFADAGDGPAIFVIMIGGAIVVGAALVTEVNYQPPYWVHAVLWIPLILIVTLRPLRGLKSVLIALQYHHKASQGKFVPRAIIRNPEPFIAQIAAMKTAFARGRIAKVNASGRQ